MNLPVPLEIRGLSKAFGATPVLDGVDLSAASGEVVVLMGGSGSGKSTLLRCILGLEVPDAGRIAVAGIEIPYRQRGRRREIAPMRPMQDIRRRVGTCFQAAQLWSHRSVLENVIEAPVHVAGRDRVASIAAAERLLEAMGLADKRDHYPAQLSGGQQQRVAIARALAIDPELLLFDEPTAGLDPLRTRDVLAVLRRLAGEGRSMLVATHEIDFAREAADRVLFMAGGRIVAEGPPATMFGPAAPAAFRQFCCRLDQDGDAA